MKKIYNKVFLLSVQRSIEYRADFFLHIISVFFILFMQIFMWRALYMGTTELFSYSYTQILQYSIAANFISKISMASTTMAWDIKNGNLNRFLVKPINYFFYNFVDLIGGKIFIILLSLLCIMLTLGIFNGTLAYVPIALVSIFLSIILNYLIHFSISCLGFWLHEINNLFGTIYIIQLLLSGGIFPLNVFGNLFTTISMLLPFQYTLQTPANIITGYLIQKDIIFNMLMQIVWILIVSFISAKLWNAGLKKYISAGG